MSKLHFPKRLFIIKIMLCQDSGRLLFERSAVLFNQFLLISCIIFINGVSIVYANLMNVRLHRLLIVVLIFNSSYNTVII